MPENVFTPNLQNKPATEQEIGEIEATPDRMSDVFIRVARMMVVGFTLFLPLFFIPGLWATLGFQKSLLALISVVVVLIILSLLMLRQSHVRTIVPLPWICFLGFVVVAAASALFSDSPVSALRGDVLETGTVAFFALMAGVMAIPLVLQQNKKYMLRVFQSIVVGSLIVLVYCVVRLFFGPILAFESFSSVTTSPLGGFNDLAVFAGLSILVSLIALLQLPLKMALQVLLLVVTVLSLIVLAVVNFFFVWLVTGFFGLLMLLYVVSRDRLFASFEEQPVKSNAPSRILILTTAIVCLMSAWFIVMGDFASKQINDVFGISYLEVRPSFSATVDIAKEVYAENLLLGTGPNQFIDGWRQHKDISINETMFWATDFSAGSSYSTTIAVTTGLLGLIMLILFHGWYAWFGLRMLVTARQQDKFWYFAGVVSFAGAAFLWLMTYLYVPGSTILLLAALLTGVSFAAGASLMPKSVRSIALVSNRQRGFGLMALAILVISGSIGTLFTVSEQYLAQASFNKTQATAADVSGIDQAALSSYSRYASDVFLGVRARIALVEMNQLLSVTDPSEVEQQQFLNVSGRGLAAANQAILVAPKNPEYRVILAAMYNNLALAGVQDALARAISSLNEAKLLDPKNPTYSLVEAQMAVRRGDVASARQSLQLALEKKRNFTEALFLLAQIDIAEGNTESAIVTTEAIITLEPNNPTRYYQLGILQTAAGDSKNAQAAYESALRLDPSYANARYFRALLLANAGNRDEAISELKIVQESNSANELLAELISQLSSGATTSQPLSEGVAVPVLELTPQADDSTVTSPAVPDSDLLTPLNTVPSGSSAETSEEIFSDTNIVDRSEEDAVVNPSDEQ